MNAFDRNTEQALRGGAVYASIGQVAAAMCAKGVDKSRKNQQQGYAFRGIDEFYAALSPELVRANLLILPRGINREIVERRSKDDKALFYVTVTMEFDFVSAVDGSRHTVGPFFGEAMDSADKATNKAMSAAYKYCVMQAFAVPVQGQSIDAEQDSHDVAPRAPTIDELTDAQKIALQEMRDASLNGMDAFKAAWRGLPDDMRDVLRPIEFDSLKTAATRVDIERKRNVQ